jgi:hypothetical protein
MHEAAPGVAETFEIAPERVRDSCIEDALALARMAANDDVRSGGHGSNRARRKKIPRDHDDD